MEQTQTEKSHQDAQNVIDQSSMLSTLTYPRWVEIIISAEVQDEQDFEELFDWAGGGQGGPICPTQDLAPCDACAAAGDVSGAPCAQCDGAGQITVCSREHVASAQHMVNGMSAWEWSLRCRLEALLAQLETGDTAGAMDALRHELEGFEPLLAIR